MTYGHKLLSIVMIIQKQRLMLKKATIKIIFPKAIIVVFHKRKSTYVFYSLNCREGYMKKNRLRVCVFASGSKEHHISKWILLTIDGWDMAGPYVIGVGEYESGYISGSKVKRTSILETRNSWPLVNRTWSNPR